MLLRTSMYDRHAWCHFPIWDLKSPSAGLSILNPPFPSTLIILSYISLFFRSVVIKANKSMEKFAWNPEKNRQLLFLGKTWEYIHFSEGNISPPALCLLWDLMRYLMSAGRQGFLLSHQVPVITIVILNYWKWLISVVTPAWLVTFQSPLSCCLLIGSQPVTLIFCQVTHV